jgi:transcriptional regulator with XRE-family HTH domain
VSTKIKEELRLRRLLMNLSQRQVAEEAGIHPVSLSRYESGTWIPSSVMVERILSAISRLTQAKGGGKALNIEGQDS